jgi:hypothetical protein
MDGGKKVRMCLARGITKQRHKITKSRVVLSHVEDIGRLRKQRGGQEDLSIPGVLLFCG